MTDLLAPGSLLLERYRVIETLGQGTVATTYLVEDAAPRDAGTEGAPPTRLVAKRFSAREALGARGRATVSLGEPDGLKLVELFEREARILSGLRHPRVPRFVDFVTREHEDDVELVLVQEYVAGKSLADLAGSGHRFTEKEVVTLGLEVARILGDLHALRPPLVHRDVKPSNILKRDSDGALFLIDFGAVKHRVGGDGLDEATVVGSLGYMPLEQFEGRATPASDVHALGATLLALLTGRAPHELPRSGGRLDYRSLVPVSDDLASVLDRALAPDPEARHADGAALAEELERVARGEPPRVPTAKAAPRTSHRALLVALAAGAFLAVAASTLHRDVERALDVASATPWDVASATPGGDPMPFSRPSSPLPVGPKTAPVLPFFTQYPAGRLVAHLGQDAAGDVWAALDGHDPGLFVRFADADPSRPALIVPGAVPADLVALYAAYRKGTSPTFPADVTELLSRELPGVRISAVARAPGQRLWVAGGGLHLRDGGLWYRMTVAEGLPADPLAVLVDRRGGLWVGAYPTLLHAEEKVAAERIKTVPRVGAATGSVFESAAWAVEKLLGERHASGGVSYRRTEQHTLVFFDGRLVAPGPRRGYGPTLFGHRREDGRTVVFDQGVGTAWGKAGTAIQLPRKPERMWVQGTTLTSRGEVLVWDPRDVAFLPEGDDGQYRGPWVVHPELSNLDVQDTREDAHGRLWLATKSGNATLHAWNGAIWQHVPCKQRAFSWPSMPVFALGNLRDGRFSLSMGSDGKSPVLDPSNATALDCEAGTPELPNWSAVALDGKGRKWMLASGAGLQLKLHLRDGDRFVSLGVQDGLLEPRAFTFDGEGRLWLLDPDGRVGVYPIEPLVERARAAGAR